jgi:hypothetical protein
MMTPWNVTRVALLTVAAPAKLLIALLTLAVLTGLMPLDNVAGMATVIGFIEAVIGVFTVTLHRSEAMRNNGRSPELGGIASRVFRR